MKELFMKKTKAFYVQVFGSYTHNHLVSLLREEIDDRLTTSLCLVGTTRPIPTYRLNSDEMKTLEASRASEKLNFRTHRLTKSDGLVDISTSVAEYLPAGSGPSNNVTVRKTKAKIKALLKRRKTPLVTA